MSGIVANADRQAHDAVRGYVYQVLRCVDAWLDLVDGEEIFVEGGEDLDLISGSSATLDQIKDTAGSGNISLRTSSVIDTMNNYWSHAEANQSRQVRMRYVTTSHIGFEQERPFGEIPGLAHWNKAASTTDAGAAIEATRQLVAFVLDQLKPVTSLRTFLSGGTAEEHLQRLIRPILWMAGQADCDALVRRIKDRLVEHGSASSVAPRDAEQAFEKLYVAAFDTARTKEAPPLTRGGFLRLFAEATTIQLPKQDVAALVKAALSPTDGAQLVRAALEVVEAAPPIPPRYFLRQALEQRVGDALAGGVALVHGATGTGKTLMAASALRTQPTAWLALRDLEPDEAKRRLILARTLLHERGAAVTVVLDDIDTHGDPRILEGTLGALGATQKELGGAILVTGDRELPPRLAQALGLERAAEILMPPFDEFETQGFLAQEGCPDDLRDSWTNILELTSLGHPQLLHARVAEIKSQGFPVPSADDIVAPSGDVDRVRTEARRIIARIPDEAKELLYRASLVSTRMSRGRLMALARLENALIEPGEAVDRIAGPWLELMDTGDYRVSPLVRGAAEEARGLDWTKAMHAKVAWVFLMDRKLTPFDISSVLTHCLLGGSSGPLAHLLPSLFAKSDEIWNSIGEVCGMYATIATGSDDRLPFKRSLDNFLFRIFQYRIACAVDPDLAMRIAERFDAESAAAGDDDSTLYFRFVFQMQVLKQVEVAYPVAALIARGLEFSRLSRTLQDTRPGRRLRAGLSPEDTEVVSAERIRDFISFALLSRVNEPSDLEQLLDVVDALPTEDGRDIVKALACIPEQAALVAERLWLARAPSRDPRWEDVRELYLRAVEFGISAGVPTLADAFAVVLVRIVDEQLGRPDDAVKLAEALLPRLGSPAVLQAALARAIGHVGDALRAVDLWKVALDAWPVEHGRLEAAFALRDGAIAAARAGDFHLSATWFEAAMPLGTDSATASFVVGLATDGALARFLGGETIRGLAGLESTVDLIVRMDQGSEVEPWLSLRRRVAGALGVMADPGSAPDGALEKLVGMCSNVEPFASDSAVAPPLDLITLHLVDAACAVGGGASIGSHHVDRLRATNFAAFRSIVPPALMRVARDTGDYALLVRDALMQADALTECAGAGFARGDPFRLSDDVQRPWTDGVADMALGQMIAAIYDLAANDRLDQLPLDAWRRDAAAHHEAQGIVSFIDFVDGLLIQGGVDPWRLMAEGRSKTWAEQSVAALASSLWQSLAPAQLIQCHAIFAQYLNQPHVSAMGAEPVAVLVARQWAVRADHNKLSASGDAFESVRTAVALGGAGWAATRRILVAAVAMLGLDPDDQARVQIEAIVVDG